MLEITRVHHVGGKSIIKSHLLNPGDEISLFVILEWTTESSVSVIEDHILETLSKIEWNKETIENDFSYVSERYNQFIKSLTAEDSESLSCILSILIGNKLSLCSSGKTEWILIEKWDISTISSHDEAKYIFQYITHWDIPSSGTVYLSNIPLTSLFSESNLEEMSGFSEDDFKESVHLLLEEEWSPHAVIFRIRNQKEHTVVTSKRKQWDIFRDKWTLILSHIQKSKILKDAKAVFDTHFENNRKHIQYLILGFWVIILFFLAFALIGSLFNAINTTSSDMKNDLLKAQSLIIDSQKLTNNKEAFSKNIKQAEEILFRLRSEKVHIADTEDLLSRIEVMKKEVNDIQTIDLKWLSSIVKYDPLSISPLWVFEYNKKLNLIWKAWAIIAYTRGEPEGKVIPYPAWEQAKSFHFSEDGDVFILTETDRMLTIKRNDFSYVTVTWGNGWEKSKKIRVFNNNLYTLSADGKSISRHRPGLNWFSSASRIMEDLPVPILDFGIDGGIYLLDTWWKMERFVSGKAEWNTKWLILNKIPWEYTLGQEDPSHIIGGQNLSYVYILSGNRIWIFSPDSKRFQDISSLTYIAQLEIQTDEEVKDLFVVRDGTIYITTNLGVYEKNFEVVDGKILIR